jgi:hypothetical protein
MKKLLPLERISSVGRIHKLAAIIVAASVSCLPLSALADHTDGGGGGHAGGGGGHPGGGGGHPGGASHGSFHPAASYHPSAPSYHASAPSYHASAPSYHASAPSYHASAPSYHASAPSYHVSAPSYHASSRTAHSGFASNATHSYHANLYSTNNSSSHVSNHHETAATTHRETSTTQHDATVNRVTNTNHNLSQTNRASVARNTSRLNDPGRTPKAEALRARTPFDHSMTGVSAHGMMNQRLNQIANRQWAGHGAFYADHFDRDHGCWFNHGGYWWRCNYWGANSYCDNLIGLGFAPGLCWTWYDDICAGNIVVGMPLDLVDYYYPDPVYSDYTTYDGDDATVYYYPMDDGQYKQVTVVDGNVVDVEIVDQVS